jgi:tetratricopeptide (TPR) repeat protein
MGDIVTVTLQWSGWSELRHACIISGWSISELLSRVTGICRTFCVRAITTDPQRDLEQARTLAQNALILDDSNVFALWVLAELDWEQRRFDEAIANGQRAVAHNPNDAAAYAALGDAIQ